MPADTAPQLGPSHIFHYPSSLVNFTELPSQPLLRQRLRHHQQQGLPSSCSRFFHRHGHWVVFVFRFLPSFRTLISLPAGMAKMPLWKFLLFTFVGSAIWNTMLAAAGVLLGSRFQELDRYVGPFAIATTVLVVSAYLYRVATWKPREE